MTTIQFDSATPPNGGARRELLAVICQHFRQIHDHIKDLSPVEFVAVPGHPEVLVPFNDLKLDASDGYATVRLTINGSRVDYSLNTLIGGLELATETLIETSHGEKYSTPTIVVNGDYLENGSKMSDNHSTNIGRDVVSSQVGQVLVKCQNSIQMQPASESKELLDYLRTNVEELIDKLPANKRDKASKIARSLEILIEQATSDSPDEEWYALSAKGLLEASAWVKNLSGNIGETVLKIGQHLWPTFNLPL